MTNANALPHRKSLRPALLWATVCLILLGVLLSLLPGARLNSSVLAMLPKQTLGAIPPALNDAFMQRLDRQLVWLVSPGKEPDPRVAQQWLDLLKNSHSLREVKGPMDAAGQKAWGEFFWQHRNGLIDSATRARLQNGGEAQAQWILSQLYSAFSGVSGKELQNDPLMLMRGSQLALAQNSQKLRLMDGWLVTQDASGNYWYMLHGELAGSSFDMQQTHQLVTTLTALQETLKTRFPQAQLLSRGTVFYSDYASQQAKRDISTLGIVTILGVILLILAVFRSLKPLLLCLISIATGALAGTVVTLLLFGELHLMTLVMSMSIIGISADYTLYYLTERMVHGAEHSPWQSLAKVRNALLLALLVAPFVNIIPAMSQGPMINRRHAEMLSRAQTVVPKDATLWLWWDWGYAAHHFAHRLTIADGARNAGAPLYLSAAVLGTDNPRFARQLIRYTSQFAKGRDPFDEEVASEVFAGLDAQQAQDLMDKLRSPETALVEGEGRQFVTVSFEMLRLGFWISNFGNWDFVTRQGEGAALSILPQAVAYNLDKGEVLLDDSATPIRPASISVFEETGVTRRDYIQQWFDSHPRATAAQRQEFLSGRRNVHFFFNRITDEKLAMDANLYNSLMVRLLVGNPQDPAISPYFKLVYDNVFCRIYEVL